MLRIHSTNPLSSHHKFRDASMMSTDCQLHWISWVQKITVTTISRSKPLLEWRDFCDSSDSCSFWWNDNVDDTNFSRNSGCCSSHRGNMPVFSLCTSLLSSIWHIHSITVLFWSITFSFSTRSLMVSNFVTCSIFRNPLGSMLSYDIICHFLQVIIITNDYIALLF